MDLSRKMCTCVYMHNLVCTLHSHFFPLPTMTDQIAGDLTEIKVCEFWSMIIFSPLRPSAFPCNVSLFRHTSSGPVERLPFHYSPATEYPSIREGRDDRTLSFGQEQARNEGHQCPAESSKVSVYALVRSPSSHYNTSLNCIIRVCGSRNIVRYPSVPSGSTAEAVRPGLKGPPIANVYIYRKKEREKGKNEERDSDFVRQHPRAWRTGMVMVHFGNAGASARDPRVDKPSRDDDVGEDERGIHGDSSAQRCIVRVANPATEEERCPAGLFWRVNPSEATTTLHASTLR